MLELAFHRETKQARYFTEMLGDSLGLDMVLLPGGTFTMGSPGDEPERLGQEGPQHEVTVPAFFLGRYPVTQAQWQFVAGFPQVNVALEPNPSSFKGDNRPVETVSWYDAVEFCARLAAYTQRDYGLPSEAQWEYACRANTTTPFHFGETITTALANYNGADEQHGAYGRRPKGENRQATTSVYHFGIANAFGLCDLHGNVWEWCADTCHDNYLGAPTDGSAWVTAGRDEGWRVLRGGSWYNFPQVCRSAHRGKSNPDNAHFNVGFRAVCSLPRT